MQNVRGSYGALTLEVVGRVVPGNGDRVDDRRPVADAVDGQNDDAHAQYADDHERGDYEYGHVDAQHRERRGP